MKPWIALSVLMLCAATEAATKSPPTNGVASWYGESHRGRLMANGKRFNPDRLTAASWFYPLGTKVRVFHGKKRGKIEIEYYSLDDLDRVLRLLNVR